MVYAVAHRRNMCEGNTRVESNGTDVRVFLHGNCIYKIVDNVASFTLAGWNTPTTRSRLRALCVGVSQRNWEAYYNGQAISACKWYEVIR